MFLTSFALIAALSAGPTQTAFVTTSPVQVGACAVAPPIYQEPSGYSSPAMSTLALTFTNRDARTATSVTFDVSDGRTTSRIVDNGTFSSNVRIDRDLSSPQYAGGSTLSCEVRSIAFADGSTWKAQ